MPEDRGSALAPQEQIRGPRVDAAVGALAARQHGVVARRQLAALGLTPSMLESRIVAGRLVRLHRGVYAVGHAALRREGWWLAAVLAAGPGAALSHRDAAALHGLLASEGARIDVTTAAERGATARLRIHGRRRLHRLDVAVVAGIPATTVARTLVDLAEVVRGEALARALSEAERRLVLDVDAIEAAMARIRGRRGPGPAAIRRALAEHAARGATLTRSTLEERFLALLDAHALPRPRVNAWIGGFEVDAVWDASRVVAELDGWAFHRDRRAFQRDRAKGNALQAAGYVVLRFTHDDLTRRAADVAAQLTRACGSARRPRAGGRRAS